MRKLFLFFLIFAISLSFAYSIPELPMIISGDVLINEKPAKIGTEITAVKNNQIIEKVEITEKGKFTLLLQKLNENDKVDFYVEGIPTQQNINYKSGDYKQLSLKVEKHVFFYYMTGGLIALTAVLIIWKLKRK